MLSHQPSNEQLYLEEDGLFLPPHHLIPRSPATNVSKVSLDDFVQVALFLPRRKSQELEGSLMLTTSTTSTI